MSKDILSGLIGQYKRGLGFYYAFIDNATPELWTARSGKFPAWQQVYHAAEVVYFFIAPKAPADRQSLFSLDVMLLKDTSQPAPDKEALRKVCNEADAYADQFFAALTDADLAKIHEGFSSRINFQSTNAAVVTGLASHLFYHLGYIDAILREHGKPTLF